MSIFKKYILDDLNEVLLTVGSKPYPNFGNVVILAGGAASGKGFIKDKLLAFEGRSLDVDSIKELALRSDYFEKKVKEEFNVELKDMDLKNPESVTKLHAIFTSMKIPDKRQEVLYASIMKEVPERKPNILFDVTLKNITKLNNLTANLTQIGYKRENIHIVWVINDIKVALEQNRERERVVADDILLDTHEGVSLTMKKLVDMGDAIKQYMDGTIALVFNKRGEDIFMKKSDNGGSYIEEASYVIIKKPGKEVDLTKLNSVVDKIREYTPKIHTW